jgi:phospholipid/cholesterol/gamma-HCH transport system ATP-binding protein
MGALIRLEHVELSFDGSPVLRDISFQIERSETVCLIGASGGGKSTLLRVTAGLLPPDEGEVFYGSRSLYRLRDVEMLGIQQQTGFVFQDAALLANMSVFDNLALPLRYHFRLEEDQVAVRVEALMRALDLAPWAKLRPAKLSIGTRILVSLARAIILDPEIMFYDDPVSNIDAGSAEKVLSIIRDRRARSMVTSVIATNDIDFARSVGERMLVLHDGRIIADGDYRSLISGRDPLVRQLLQYGIQKKKEA